ncbi:MAG: hypothetical protein ABIF88_01610 [archaeon]
MKKLLIVMFGIMFLVGCFGFVCGEGLLWSLESEPFGFTGMSIGDNGGLFHFLPSGFNTNHQIYSLYDLNSPSDIFGRELGDIGSGDYVLNSPQIDVSNDNSDEFYTYFRRAIGITNPILECVLQKVSSESSEVLWEHITPLENYQGHWDFNVFISDDGERIVTLTNDGSTKTLIEVIDSQTGAVLSSNHVGDVFNGYTWQHAPSFTHFKESAVSEDGSILVYANPIRGWPIVVDVNTGDVLYYGIDEDLFEQIRDHGGFVVGINHDGSRIISDDAYDFESLGGSDYKYKYGLEMVEKQSDGTYLSRLIYDGEDLKNYVCNVNQPQRNIFFPKMKISKDGSLIFYSARVTCNIESGGYDTTEQYFCFGIFNIDTEQGDVKYCFKNENFGELDQQSVNDLSVSEDENTFAVGIRGNFEDSIPEVYVFKKDVSGVFTTFDTEGSANNVELSYDGTKLAVNDNGCHGMEDNCNNPRKINLYEIGEPDLTLTGVPRAGSTVRFEQPYLGGGQINRVLYSKTFRPSMTPFGWLYPDRHSLFILPRGIDGGALTRTVFTIPDEVGEEYWFQGLSFNPRGLSENYVKVRVLNAAG